MKTWQQSEPVVKKTPKSETIRLLQIIKKLDQATKVKTCAEFGGELRTSRRKFDNAVQSMLIQPVGSVAVDGSSHSIYKLSKKGLKFIGEISAAESTKERHDTRGQPFYGIPMRSARVDAEQALALRSVGLLSDRANDWV